MFFGAIVFLFTGKTATPAKIHSLISVHVPNLEADLGKATWSTSNDNMWSGRVLFHAALDCFEYANFWMSQFKY